MCSESWSNCLLSLSFFHQLLCLPFFKNSPRASWEVWHWTWVQEGWRLQMEGGAGQCLQAVLSSLASPTHSLKQSASFSKSWSGSSEWDTATLPGSPLYCWPCSTAQVGCRLYRTYTVTHIQPVYMAVGHSEQHESFRYACFVNGLYLSHHNAEDFQPTAFIHFSNFKL